MAWLVIEDRFGSIVITGGKANDELVGSETKALDRLNKGEKMDAVITGLSGEKRYEYGSRKRSK